MNKRSALLTAGGVAGSFIAGAAAVSFHWGMGTPASTEAAATTPARTHVKPIVKHRRIVVHKKAPAPHGPGGAPSGSHTVTVAPPTQSPPVVTTSGSHAGGGETDDEHEGGGDD